MFNVQNFFNNDDIKITDQLGPFSVLEYQRDLSVAPGSAMQAYYASVMNVRKRQVVCDLSVSPVTVQAGAMQWMVGNVNATTGIKGSATCWARRSAARRPASRPSSRSNVGDGLLTLEPTFKYILLLNLDDWNGSIVLEDGLFLACDSRLKHKAVMRSNFSSAAAGNEGLFNLGIQGSGALCLESPVPREELITFTLKDDVLKVDGDMAIAWSGSLDFTVERSAWSLVGRRPRAKGWSTSTGGPGGCCGAGWAPALTSAQ